MNQQQRIKAALERGESITPLQAWSKYGVYRISDVIYKLRRKGLNISTNMKPVTNQFNEVCDVANYKLEVEK